MAWGYLPLAAEDMQGFGSLEDLPTGSILPRVEGWRAVWYVAVCGGGALVTGGSPNVIGAWPLMPQDALHAHQCMEQKHRCRNSMLGINHLRAAVHIAGIGVDLGSVDVDVGVAQRIGWGARSGNTRVVEHPSEKLTVVVVVTIVVAVAVAAVVAVAESETFRHHVLPAQGCRLGRASYDLLLYGTSSGCPGVDVTLLLPLRRSLDGRPHSALNTRHYKLSAVACYFQDHPIAQYKTFRTTLERMLANTSCMWFTERTRDVQLRGV